MVDNYDAFTNNLAQQLQKLGAEIVTSRRDEYTIEQALALKPTHLMLTPGNGVYNDHGLRLQKFVEAFIDIPITGVCLGHQSLAAYFGAKIDSNCCYLRGISSEITHDGKGLYEGIPSPIEGGRYHNDAVNVDVTDTPLEVTSMSGDMVMGIRHTTLPIESFQIHPESVMTQYGDIMMKNFLKRG